MEKITYHGKVHIVSNLLSCPLARFHACLGTCLWCKGYESLWSSPWCSWRGIWRSYFIIAWSLSCNNTLACILWLSVVLWLWDTSGFYIDIGGIYHLSGPRSWRGVKAKVIDFLLAHLVACLWATSNCIGQSLWWLACSMLILSLVCAQFHEILATSE